ncbi:MAG: DUF1670 domain-containing protein [Planctomycetota bacterium]|jgi:hypothetical protein
MKAKPRDRFASIPKRNFRNAIIKLLEEEYKMVGSHKVIHMIASDIEALHKEYYPDSEKNSIGTITWRTTKTTSKKPSYGKKVEDYDVVTLRLPLIRDEDVDNRIREFHCGGYGTKHNANYKKSKERDIETMARLIKSAYKQGGLLTGAELSVLMNRSLGTIGKYIAAYHRTHDDILPTKGMILDQGSRPTHKGSIINLYEQGYPEPDISRLTNHTIESTSRYIKNYKRIKMLLEKGFGLIEMVRITGLGKKTIWQYKDLVYLYHPELKDQKNINKNREKEEVGKTTK